MLEIKFKQLLKQLLKIRGKFRSCKSDLYCLTLHSKKGEKKINFSPINMNVRKITYQKLNPTKTKINSITTNVHINHKISE